MVVNNFHMQEGRFPVYSTLEEYNVKGLKPALASAYKDNPKKGSYFYAVHCYRRGNVALGQTNVEKVTGPMLRQWKAFIAQQPNDLIRACAPDAQNPLVWILYFYDHESWRWNPNPKIAELIATMDDQMVEEIKQWTRQLVEQNARKPRPLTIVYHERSVNREYQHGILFTWG
jgi:hypothetical protein